MINPWLNAMARVPDRVDYHRRGLQSNTTAISMPYRALDLLSARQLSFVAFSLAFAPRGHYLAHEAKNMALEAGEVSACWPISWLS